MKEARVMPFLTALPQVTLLAAGLLLGGLLALPPAPAAASERFDGSAVMQIRDRHHGHHWRHHRGHHHRHWHSRRWSHGGPWARPYYHRPPPVYYLPPRPRFYHPPRYYGPRYYAPPPGVSLHFRF
jgi:hypothetical protein